MRVGHEAKVADFVDGEGFKTLVGVAQEEGVAVYIATYGNYKVVRHHMGLLWNDSPCPVNRVNIITPVLFEEIDGYHDKYRDGREMPTSKDVEVTEKNRQLAHIRVSGGWEKNDTAANVTNAKAAGYEHSYAVDNTTGLGLVEFCELVG